MVIIKAKPAFIHPSLQITDVYVNKDLIQEKVYKINVLYKGIVALLPVKGGGLNQWDIHGSVVNRKRLNVHYVGVYVFKYSKCTQTFTNDLLPKLLFFEDDSLAC